MKMKTILVATLLFSATVSAVDVKGVNVEHDGEWRAFCNENADSGVISTGCRRMAIFCESYGLEICHKEREEFLKKARKIQVKR